MVAREVLLGFTADDLSPVWINKAASWEEVAKWANYVDLPTVNAVGYIRKLKAISFLEKLYKEESLYNLCYLCSEDFEFKHSKELRKHFLVKAGIPVSVWKHYVPNGTTYFADLEISSESLREQVYTVLSVTDTTTERLSALEQHWEAVKMVGGIDYFYFFLYGEVRFKSEDTDLLPF